MKKILFLLALFVLVAPNVTLAYGGGGPAIFIPVTIDGITNWSDQARYRWYVATNRIERISDEVWNVLNRKPNIVVPPVPQPQKPRVIIINRLPSSGNKFATVIHPDTCKKRVVTVGDPNAFTGGYKLYPHPCGFTVGLLK